MESCHSSQPSLLPGSRIALVGNPNVGKSILFHRLTGKYVMVSNYPGTTVEITSGMLRNHPDVVVVDTPGIVTFPPRSEDETVTARVLLQEDLRAIVQVGDAKNLRRTLHLAIQLSEMGLPLVVALNMMDEARARGLTIDSEKISAALGVPVVATVATRGHGLDRLIDSVQQAARSPLKVEYPAEIEAALVEMQPLLPPAPISARSLGLQWLSRDAASESWINEHAGEDALAALRSLRDRVDREGAEPAVTVIQSVRNALVESLTEQALREENPGKPSLAVQLGHLASHPLWGLPILAVVLLAMYWFVGVFGASTLVGLLEEDLFGTVINPWITTQIENLIPWPFLSQILVGEYGLWTMGMTYALALLLPIVVTFFIMFGILEDSGYLPRLSVLTNRLFGIMGLNGQAVLPMVLGLGCVTMATMTTRILTSRRDRILVTLLLALAVPCSAQLGVVMGLLAGISFTATAIWVGIVILLLLAVGWLAAQLMPGEREPLLVELPPLRLPVLSNVLVKTAARLEWYIKEAVPLFLLGTLLLFLLDWFHILPAIIKAAEPLVTGWLGLPPEAATAFLLGLMRRDFAATGLFAMESQGLLTPVQMLVSIVTITLFIPCIASLFMIIKERGSKIALAMTLFIFPFAMLVGGLLQRLLVLIGWNG
ncbi:MAG: ferrous iron transport protein B [Chloroflexi bacterium]|nr:ferrous iron transport protein B [Chloroflexota bacterium]